MTRIFTLLLFAEEYEGDPTKGEEIFGERSTYRTHQKFILYDILVEKI
jgi:hypothetical protein